jgi:chromatin remodeling complex protein RSC6
MNTTKMATTTVTPTPAPVQNKKQSVKKTAVKKPIAQPEPIPIPDPEPTPVVEAVAPTPAPVEEATETDAVQTMNSAEFFLQFVSLPEDSTFQQISSKLFELQAFKNKLDREIENKTKLMSKLYQRDIKEANKSKKRKVPSDPENPKGITKPVSISDKLANFLGVPKGTKLSRPEVTKRISAYLNERNLKHADNRTIFDIDAPLKEVLGEPIHLLSRKTPELGHGYCNSNLQTYLSAHFLKDIVVQ